MVGLERDGSVSTWLVQPDSFLVSFDELRNVDNQHKLVERNTRQFFERRPANNILIDATSNRRHLVTERAADNWNTTATKMSNYVEAVGAGPFLIRSTG